MSTGFALDKPFVLLGVDQSYFTRKMSGYFDYKGLPWRLKRFGGGSAEVRAAGWTGGIPAVRTPDGEIMWDTTAMILHLEQRFPEHPVLPPDPVQRFLCFLLEDFSDEWLYRPAVGSRWLYEENRRHGSWDLARDMSVEFPVSGEQARQMVTGIMQGSIGRLGATAGNIDAWIEEVLKPWQRTLSAHLEREAHPYLFGARPSLADFAFFGGNAAHFANDPLCRRWSDEVGPAVVAHTHRLLEPDDQTFGDWLAPGEIPDSLVAVLAEVGRLYLPWVARATAEGAADVGFASGAPAPIDTTPFLTEARGVLLARYVEARSDALDAVLDRAGIRRWFADHVDGAGAIPDLESPPRPTLNQPFPSSPVQAP
ncbi:MAG: glutathione S-transferase family protein [Proteobacteria bacterium]|nr:glutathione S-transferase family protein [Pseudomonadota bacterium]